MPREEIPIGRDPAFVLKFAGSGAAFLAASVYQWLQGEIVWTAVWGVAGAVTVFYGLSTGAARCPTAGCGTLLKVSRGGETYVRCPGCGEYYEGEAGKLWKIEAGRIAPFPAFSVMLPGGEEERLNPPGIGAIPTAPALAGGDRSYDFKWPDACCVCGAKPVGGQGVSMTAVSKYARAGGLADEKVTLSVDGIPHCREHQMGATLAIDDGAAVLKFRSYSFRNAFRKLNQLQ